MGPPLHIEQEAPRHLQVLLRRGQIRRRYFLLRPQKKSALLLGFSRRTIDHDRFADHLRLLLTFLFHEEDDAGYQYPRGIDGLLHGTGRPGTSEQYHRTAADEVPTIHPVTSLGVHRGERPDSQSELSRRWHSSDAQLGQDRTLAQTSEVPVHEDSRMASDRPEDYRNQKENP